jgi:hypothetical protein
VRARIWNVRHITFLQEQNVYQMTTICVDVRAVRLRKSVSIIHNCTHTRIRKCRHSLSAYTTHSLYFQSDCSVHLDEVNSYLWNKNTKASVTRSISKYILQISHTSINGSTQHRTSWQADSHYAGQENPYLFLKLEYILQRKQDHATEHLLVLVQSTPYSSVVFL